MSLFRRPTPSTLTAGAVTFYNIAPPSRTRTPDQVHGEILALEQEGPVVIVGCEAVGHSTETLSAPRMRTIRDRRNASRANIVALVRDGHTVRKIRWHDLEKTWPRTDHPGRHEPRSFVEFQVDGTHVVVAHAPPEGAGPEVQQELVDALVQVMAPVPVPPVRPGASARLARRRARQHNARPRILVWDANRRPGQKGPGPDQVAARIGGQVVGDGVDCMVVRCATIEGWGYADQIDGLHLKTDHTRGRLRVRLSVAAAFLKETR